MIKQQAKAYNPSTRAAGLAAITLSQYTDYLLLETLVEPIATDPKSNRSSTKGKPEIKICKVYPNPTAGILLVEIPVEMQRVKFRVNDSNGRLIFQSLGTTGINSLNLRDAASGNYVLTIMRGDGSGIESHNIQIVR